MGFDIKYPAISMAEVLTRSGIYACVSVLGAVDPKMIEMIENEILDNKGHVTWDDIAGLAFAKKCVLEIVVWPMLRQVSRIFSAYSPQCHAVKQLWRV
jgi:hypothetical protein